MATRISGFGSKNTNQIPKTEDFEKMEKEKQQDIITVVVIVVIVAGL